MGGVTGELGERDAIRRILFDFWDPAGIGGPGSEVSADYDAQVGQVAARLRAGAALALIEADLRSAVTRGFGSTNSKIDYPALMRKLAELQIGD